MTQAQKEIFVNEALALTDALLQLAVEGVTATPPAEPLDGECWIVASGATGDFAEYEGRLACRQLGQWIFVKPQAGTQAYDKSRNCVRRYNEGWSEPANISDPAGGATIDAEARATLIDLIATLRTAGIIAAN